MATSESNYRIENKKRRESIKRAPQKRESERETKVEEKQEETEKIGREDSITGKRKL